MELQVWNHEFFWDSMKPRGGGIQSGILKYLIKRDFGSLGALTKEMQSAALTQFGSGWVWLACELRVKSLIHSSSFLLCL
jgi:superoxide dismutase, Fe-Mn family